MIQVASSGTPLELAGRRRRGITGSSSGAAAFTPATLPNLAGWWDFSALGLGNGASIASVNDSSTNARTLTQATGANQPTFQTAVQNGRAIARFNGTTMTMATAAFAQTQQYSIFAVVKSSGGTLPEGVANTDAVTRHMQFRYNTALAETIAFNTVPAAFTDNETATVSQFNVLSGVNSASAVQTWVNGTSGGSTATSGTLASGSVALMVGAASSNGGPITSFLTGDIGEIIYCASALSTADRQSTEAYLKARWGTP